MTTTKSCSECGSPYQGRYNSRLCPVCKAAHARKHRKAYKERQRNLKIEMMKNIMHEPSNLLHQPRPVTWWNVRTGQIEERWE